MVVEIKKCQISNNKHKGNKKSKPTMSCWYQLPPKPNLHVHNKLTYYFSMHDNKLTLNSPNAIIYIKVCHLSLIQQHGLDVGSSNIYHQTNF